MKPVATALRHAARLAAVATLGLVAVVAVPPAAHAATATFVKESQWPTGYVGRVTVHNDGTVALTSWRVEFSLPEGTTVGSFWYAQMTQIAGRYVFTNLPWNATVPPGGTVGFGFVANGTGAPQGCTVNGAPCSGVPRLDVTPPATPGNARYVAGPSTTLLWDASTDDTGVVEYQIFHRAIQIGATTATSFSMATPPPMVTTFGVRAVDAAGNISPLAPIHFGQLPDTTAPTMPPNLRVHGLSQNYFTVRWDAAIDETFLVGYEVYLNGVLVSKVGGTSAFAPYSGFGTYFFRVRAWDSSGNFGPFAQLGLAIDPPPPTPTPTPRAAA